MIGLITQGMPTSLIASRYSSLVSANLKSDVAIPNSSAAKRRIPSRFIVKLAARAVGITVWPSFSKSTKVSVAIASISGTI